MLEGSDPQARARLAAYWRARDAYLETGAQTLAARGPRDVIGTLAPRLIEIVRMSPDFEPAYLPVIAMARQMAVSDPAGARRGAGGRAGRGGQRRRGVAGGGSRGGRRG